MTTSTPTPRPLPERPWVLWDGQCGVCAWSVWWIREHDPERSLRLVPYQEAPDPPVDAVLRRRAERAVHLLLPDGRRFRAGRACVEILARLGYRRTAAVLRLPPLVWLLEIGYWLVARTRSWYGRFLPPAPKIEEGD